MNGPTAKHAIHRALQAFGSGSLKANALALFETLGYHSDKRIDLVPNSLDEFISTFDLARKINREKVKQCKTVDFLFQLTKDEITSGAQLQFNFGASNQVDDTIIESYLFLAISLKDDSYTRTQLAQITREINKHFSMPVLLLFQHGQTLSLSIINRRLHKRTPSKDVLEKVTLIKDIQFADSHRAHIEILFDLSLPRLYQVYGFNNFVGLHRAWQKVLDTTELNNRFYSEIANWYFWALNEVTFPSQNDMSKTDRQATGVIRLITRLVFAWFMKEKGLIPAELFDRRHLDPILNYTDKNDSTYYKAILQNLFFATLNSEMPKRGFRKRSTQKGSRDPNYMAHTLYRYESYFKDPQAILALFRDIPFLNGGLFECLDERDDDTNREVRIDGFSDNPKNELRVPDSLFFAQEREVDLNSIYGTAGKRYRVRGLLEILKSYKFTVAENTPIEQEIALDPELLGQVFENLLAAYNPDTQETARKLTGSFYTPREIVNYMVDEALLIHLKKELTNTLSNRSNGDNASTLESRLRQLLSYENEINPFNEAETVALIQAIDRLKILDPACGSGAFPIGILQKLVLMLSKLDPRNQRWKNRQIVRAEAIEDPIIRQTTIEDIEQAFADNELNYGRKLFLIQNCIYGVDIQPIAVEIAKLRCFIALLVDERINDRKPNRGVQALPNLETRFVAANTLISLETPQATLPNQELQQAIAQKKTELRQVRDRHFAARSYSTKKKCQTEDRAIRLALSQLLRQEHFPQNTVQKLVAWDLYDTTRHAEWFDREWMLGLDKGFDLVLGNPPYVRHELIRELKSYFKDHYDVYQGTADLYVYFYERGLRLLKPGGVLTYISSNKFMRAGYGQNLRRYLGRNTTLHTLLDFGDLPVFKATAYPAVLVLQNQKPSQEHYTKALTITDYSLIERLPDVVQEQAWLQSQTSLIPDSWNLVKPAVFNLIQKLRSSSSKSLGEYVKGQLNTGIKTGFNEAFVIDQATRDLLISRSPSSVEVIKPWIQGRDIKRWRVNWNGSYAILIQNSGDDDSNNSWARAKTEEQARKIFKTTFPAIHDYLSSFEADLRKRYDQGRFWWELRACAYYADFSKPKIVYPDIAKSPQFAYETNGIHGGNTIYIIPTNELYLLGILNSSVINFYYNQISSTIRGDYLRFIAMYMSKIPIPSTTQKQRAVIKLLVEYILFLKEHRDNSINTYVPNDHMAQLFEDALNGCVYELYFEESLKAADVDIIHSVGDQFQPVSDLVNQRKISQRIEAAYQVLREPEGEIRNRLIKQNIVVEEIRLINEALR